MAQVLGQEQLLEERPPIKVIVPQGQVCHWGVDPGSVRIAIATVDSERRRGVELLSLSTGAGAERLAAAYREIRALARSLAGEMGLPPGVIVVEQPSGAVQNLPLLYVVGVTLAALYEGVAAATGLSPRIEVVPSSKWKRVACGRGDIYKPKKQKGQPSPPPEGYEVLNWARRNGYVGSSWDAADAFGIAEYARKTYELAPR